jgi:superfamily II DNA or RNA helicase
VAAPTTAPPRSSRAARALLRAAQDLADGAAELLDAPERLRERARTQLQHLTLDEVRERMRATPLGALRDVAGRGVRWSALEQAGVRTAGAVLDAPDHVLLAVPGVGAQTVHEVRRAARAVAAQVRQDVRFRFDPDRRDPAEGQLLTTLAALRAADSALAQLQEPLRRYLTAAGPLAEAAERTGSRFSMLFAGRATKDAAWAALAELDALLADPPLTADGMAAARTAVDPRAYDPDQEWVRYLRDAASVNALLSTVGTAAPDEDAARGFVPDELRQRIVAVPLDTSLLTATLRGYQVFGAQYALHQGRSILGDEMGLGKTVQALAAMAHLAADGQRRFLVVCPASVQVNWLKETAKHTHLTAHALHGPGRDDAGRRWLREGGVAVTTFGTLGRLAEDVRASDVAMLVVDEAHMVKNPGAARSGAVVAVPAQRTLFLTGTPMENRVEEFRTLVGYLQPQVARRVGPADAVAGARAFRRAVAPVYLRRNQVDVLSELPDRIDTDAWVQPTAADAAAYREAVAARNLHAMRQATFTAGSAKLERLAEIVEEAAQDGMKVLIFSYYLAALRLCGETFAAVGTITGAVPGAVRQQLVDEFTAAPGHAVLLSQVEAGGVGINLQAASVVVLVEPQWKPSTEEQAIARAHRMGQVRTVQVHRLLAQDSIDERIREVQEGKRLLFDEFARRSEAKEADARAVDTGWHRPDVLDDETVPVGERVLVAERARLGLDG